MSAPITRRGVLGRLAGAGIALALAPALTQIGAVAAATTPAPALPRLRTVQEVGPRPCLVGGYCFGSLLSDASVAAVNRPG